ncbi:hypothetical protein DUNSADRAFT_15165 [Dunaliella salina]|uniref:Secreted protein n=1 Tax=Dunaliella salina TaxID=3046 RepID=A0ABQ7G606_DUNSA|nr:hypothetical protein DUNSADRAFT_15165 [Dunaliella salina]|eukprot:KAF5830021.1 hypothetical protein DUNSADRAFT_15165 [Dunaliella salina]
MTCSCLIAVWCFASTPMSLEATVSRLRSSCSARTVQRVPYGVSGSPATTWITSSVASTFFPALAHTSFAALSSSSAGRCTSSTLSISRARALASTPLLTVWPCSGSIAPQRSQLTRTATVFTAHALYPSRQLWPVPAFQSQHSLHTHPTPG